MSMSRESKSLDPNVLRLPTLYTSGRGSSRVSYLTPRLRCSRIAPDIAGLHGARGRTTSVQAVHGSFTKRSITGLILGVDEHKQLQPGEKNQIEAHDWSNLLANSGIRSSGWLTGRCESDESQLQKKTSPSELSADQSQECSEAVCRALQSPFEKWQAEEVATSRGIKLPSAKKRPAGNQSDRTPRARRPRRGFLSIAAPHSGPAVGGNASPESNISGGSSGASPTLDRLRQDGARRPSVLELQAGLCRHGELDLAKSRSPVEELEASAAATAGPEANMRTRMAAKRFEASLSSFQQLVNSENLPMSVAEAVERLKPIACGGSNFAWQRSAKWGNGYGASVNINFSVILWYHNWDQPDVKSRVSSSVSFLHKEGCAYIYQPCLPITALVITPRQTFRPMFDMDPRSFHTFKLAWRHFLDFGVSDYRIIVGEQLEQWTQRCKAVIEKPLNAVYWLMLMVGSHYREVLVKRSVLHGFKETFERVPVICVDSFVALSALLFSPERQVLYAGTDPTPSYLQWLQYIADQQSSRKDARNRKPDCATVFEMNEFLDVSVIIVYYGRIQQKVKESKPLSWVGNPTLIKSYIAQYAEDNRCICQLEQAVRLYTYSAALGEHSKSTNAGDRVWYCWNGLHACEIGIPMPSTHATFLSPFVTTKCVALLCPLHGPDADRVPGEAKDRKKHPGDDHSDPTMSARPSVNDGGMGMGMGMPFRNRPSRPSSQNSAKTYRSGSGALQRGDEATSSAGSSSDEFDIFTESQSSSMTGAVNPSTEGAEEGKTCSCFRYLKVSHEQRKVVRRTKPGQASLDAEVLHALQAVAPYDVMHCFIAVLTGCLNHAKQIIRSHFSIDPAAYKNLPLPQKVTWPEAMIPWYREFHRPDAHGRSRYGMLLQSLVRGLLGDGYTSGLHDEVLDIVRIQAETKELDKTVEASAMNMKAPDRAPASDQAAQPKKQTSMNIIGLRRPSQLFGVSRAKSGSLVSVSGGKHGRDDGLDECPPSPSPLGQGNSQSSYPHNRQIPVKGVIADFMLWTELYESESLYNYRSHFETFTQWCHAAHLIPFLRRCYRRSGIAGLLPGQRCGGGPKEADPNFPLVLPTIPDFCYGQCYPLHRVLEYFYGGMSTIVASIDDPQTLESMRSSWRLIPGQDRLNNLCWFQLHPREHDVLQQMYDNENAVNPSTALNMYLLQQLEDHAGFRGTSTMSLADGALSSIHQDHSIERNMSTSSCTTTVDMAIIAQLENPHKFGCRSSSHRRTMQSHSGGGNMVTTRRSRAFSRKAHVGMRALQGKTAGAKAKGKLRRDPEKVGMLSPEDPFFWFCSHNYALHVYPADYIPKHFLSDGSSLVYAYTDFISRTGTPEPSHRATGGLKQTTSKPTLDTMNKSSTRDSMAVLHRATTSDIMFDTSIDDDRKPGHIIDEHAIVDGKVVPPSICLCQPTDLSQHARQRWTVEQEFVDDRKLILGDTGWFPGAMGMRFSFETTTADVDRYIRLSSMPQAQLLYVEHQLLPQREKSKDERKDAKSKETCDPDFENSSASEESDVSEESDRGARKTQRSNVAASRKRHMRERYAQQERRQQELANLSEQQHSIMLPPILMKDGIMV